MYSPNESGFYQIPIANFGRRLQDNFGLRIVEHPEFGGVTDVHAPNSFHKYGEAIDIQDWRGGSGEGAEGFDGVGYVQRTKNLRDRLKGSGVEVIGPGDMEGHETHLHLAGKDGLLNLNKDQYSYFYGGEAGGNKSTFAPLVSPATTTNSNSGTSPVTPESEAAAQSFAKNYIDMTKTEMKDAYDKLRAEDPAKARVEGMKMHKAFFKK